MQAILKILMSRGLNKGLFEGNRTWIYLGGVALALRMLHKFSHPEPKVVFSKAIKPGETFVFTHDQLADGKLYGPGLGPTVNPTRRIK